MYSCLSLLEQRKIGFVDRYCCIDFKLCVRISTFGRIFFFPLSLSLSLSLFLPLYLSIYLTIYFSRALVRSLASATYVYVLYLTRMHFAVAVGNEEVTRLDDGTVGRPRALFCLSDDVIFSRLFLFARHSRDAARSALCSPGTTGSRTQTCKMARPAVATQTPSTLAAATATGSHIPAMVSRRSCSPGSRRGLAIARV